MKVINIINDELIEIREFAKPNACFQTNEYPDNYDFCILKEQFNPFDLFNDNKIKNKQLENIRNYIKQSDLGKMLWGRELMKILDKEEQ